MRSVFMVVEDEPDIRLLVRMRFSLDPEFQVDGEASDVESAIAAAASSSPDLIVLDHRLEGQLTGLQGAPLLKQKSPTSKILMFSASEEQRVPAAQEPSIDAFLLKTEIERLVPLSRRLLGMD